MDLHERQQFDFLLFTAAERFADRLIQRNGGAAHALHRLQTEPQGEGVWLNQFVDALFDDFLLNNADGACFVLRAVPKRLLPTPPSGPVEMMLLALAKAAFAELLAAKADEHLQRESALSGD